MITFVPINNGTIIYFIQNSDVSGIIMPNPRSLQLHHSLLDITGNFRPVKPSFVDELYKDITSYGGYNKEFYMKAIGPFPFEQQFADRPYNPLPSDSEQAHTSPARVKYFLRNGQHRYHAMIKFWADNPDIPEDERTFPVNVYPATLNQLQVLEISANLVHAAYPDAQITKYKNVNMLIEAEMAPEGAEGDGKVKHANYRKVYKDDTSAAPSDQWIDQLKRVFMYPIRSRFSVNRFKSLTGEAALDKGKKKAKEDAPRLMEVTYKTGYQLIATDTYSYSSIGYELRQQILRMLFTKFTIVESSYNPFFTLIGCLVCLSPLQVKNVMKKYLDEHDMLIRDVPADEENLLDPSRKQLRKEINTHNSALVAFCKSIKFFLEFLYNNIPSNSQLPNGYQNKGPLSAKDLTTSEIWHIFKNSMTTPDITTCETLLSQCTLKEIGNWVAFNFGPRANETHAIIKRWIKLFEISPSQTEEVARPLGLMHEESGCSFYHCCAFDWMQSKASKNETYNLVLGDIPVCIFRNCSTMVPLLHFFC